MSSSLAVGARLRDVGHVDSGTRCHCDPKRKAAGRPATTPAKHSGCRSTRGAPRASRAPRPRRRARSRFVLPVTRARRQSSARLATSEERHSLRLPLRWSGTGVAPGAASSSVASSRRFCALNRADNDAPIRHVGSPARAPCVRRRRPLRLGRDSVEITWETDLVLDLRSYSKTICVPANQARFRDPRQPGANWDRLDHERTAPESRAG